MYLIRKAKKEDMNFIIDLASKEGWLPGLYDAELFFEADKNGFFIGELNGTPISCISAVNYGEYAFIGLYIVKEELRGRGYGYKIWDYAIKYLGGMNIGLDGVLAQVENYKKSGFKKYHTNARYFGNMLLIENNNQNIIAAKEIDFEKLSDYDAKHFGAPRQDFLKKLINQSRTYSYCYLKENDIKGFVAARPIKNGYRIGPLFSENLETADALLRKIISKMNENNFYIDINQEFSSAVKLVNKYGLKKVFETARMYTKARPNALWEEVFGITSYELG